MTSTTNFDVDADVAPRRSAATAPVNDTTTTGIRGQLTTFLLVTLRLAMGWTFLWPFLDKTFGLGHETPSDAAWIHGGSPTTGFLANAPKGPFASTFNGLAGSAWADWLFMLGLLGIGVALLLGIFMRLAAGAGALMLVLMWAAVLPPANNIFLDDHLVYAVVLILLAATYAGRTFGFGRQWEALPFVRKMPILK